MLIKFLHTPKYIPALDIVEHCFIVQYIFLFFDPLEESISLNSWSFLTLYNFVFNFIFSILFYKFVSWALPKLFLVAPSTTCFYLWKKLLLVKYGFNHDSPPLKLLLFWLIWYILVFFWIFGGRKSICRFATHFNEYFYQVPF